MKILRVTIVLLLIVALFNVVIHARSDKLANSSNEWNGMQPDTIDRENLETSLEDSEDGSNMQTMHYAPGYGYAYHPRPTTYPAPVGPHPVYPHPPHPAPRPTPGYWPHTHGGRPSYWHGGGHHSGPWNQGGHHHHGGYYRY